MLYLHHVPSRLLARMATLSQSSYRPSASGKHALLPFLNSVSAIIGQNDS
jgi:hypothetical protein